MGSSSVRTPRNPSRTRSGRTTSAHRAARAAAACAAALIVVGLAQAPATAADPSGYTMVDLGKLGRNATGTAINARSEVVGDFFDVDRGYRAFLSSPQRTGGVMVELPGLACPGCDPVGVHAQAINNRGDIAGQASTPDGQHAVMWVGGTIRDLGTFGADIQVTAMNNRREITGYALVDEGWHGFRWSQAAGFRDLTPGMQWARPYDINNRGQIVGECGPSAIDVAACLWEPDGTLRVIADPPDLTAEARGINDRGVVVGEYGDSTRHSRAFMWEDGVLTFLTDSAFPTSTATDINNAGVVIGYRYLRDPDGPWVWRDGQLFDLPASASTVRMGPAIPHDINNAGVITGDSGTPDDPWDHAVIWKPDRAG